MFPVNVLLCGDGVFIETDGSKKGNGKGIFVALKLRYGGKSCGQESEYENRHKPVWPELEDQTREHGVRTYPIFFYRKPGAVRLCRPFAARNRGIQSHRRKLPTNGGPI